MVVFKWSAFNSNDLSSNPTEAYSYSVKFVFEKIENKHKKVGLAHFWNKHQFLVNYIYHKKCLTDVLN